MAFIIFRNYYFWISIKNLTKCNILKTFWFKNNEKFADHISKKFCFWSLALTSTISVLGHERVCARKVGPWPWFFFLSPWPRSLCPRLHSGDLLSKQRARIMCVRHAFARIAQQTRVLTTCNRLFSTVVEDKFFFSLH